MTKPTVRKMAGGFCRGGAINYERLHDRRGSTPDCDSEGAREKLRPAGWDEEEVAERGLPFIGQGDTRDHGIWGEKGKGKG